MCIAIYKPADLEISYETLQQCYITNPDGCGLAHINPDGDLDVYTTMDFEEFYEIYQMCLEDTPHSPFLLHFRIATHGVVNEDNCHPFFIDDKHVFMHNGTITPMTVGLSKGSGKSDTVKFGEEILEKLPEDWMDYPAITKLIEEYIGWSKIVVMDDTGFVKIYNEHKGVWDGGIWFSNKSYQIYKKPAVPKKSESVFEQCEVCNSYKKDVHWVEDSVYGWTYSCKECIDKGHVIVVERLVR